MTRIERASGLAVGQVREQTQCFQTLFDRRISKWFFPNMLQSIWVAISERQAARSKHEMCQYLLSKHSTLYTHTRHTTKIRNETTEWTNASSFCTKHSNSKGLPRRKDARHIIKKICHNFAQIQSFARSTWNLKGRNRKPSGKAPLASNCAQMH